MFVVVLFVSFFTHTSVPNRFSDHEWLRCSQPHKTDSGDTSHSKHLSTGNLGDAFLVVSHIQCT